MFQKGDYIVYGSYGLCEVREVGKSPVDPSDSRVYYALHPVYSPEGSMIFTPVDNQNTVRRHPISRKEADLLLENAPHIPALTVEREKLRRDVYRAALQTAEPEKLVALLRTVLERRRDTGRLGRRLTDADTDYEKKARDNLVGELSLVLSMSEKDTCRMVETVMGAEGLYE